MNNKFGKRLKDLRTEKNITQEKFGVIFNMSKANISRYEAGIQEPSFETLEKIAVYFNVSVAYLLGDTDIRNNAEEGGKKQELLKIIARSSTKKQDELYRIAKILMEEEDDEE
jgi:transcriptional regulator with XRE-family HTH domain